MGYEIRIEVDEATDRSLQELASRLSVEASILGGNLVREQLKRPYPSPESLPVEEDKMAHFYRVLAEIEQISFEAGAPALSDEALTREAMYADHD